MTASHGYAAVGTYTATLTVTDNLGATHSDSAGINVMAAPAGGSPWVKRFGGTGADMGQAVAVGPAGNVVAAGYFLGTADFGSGPLISAGSSASMAPAKPAMMILMASCEPKIACANTSTATLRFARPSAAEASVFGIGAIRVLIALDRPERRVRVTYGQNADRAVKRNGIWLLEHGELTT